MSATEAQLDVKFVSEMFEVIRKTPEHQQQLSTPINPNQTLDQLFQQIWDTPNSQL